MTLTNLLHQSVTKSQRNSSTDLSVHMTALVRRIQVWETVCKKKEDTDPKRKDHYEIPQVCLMCGWKAWRWMWFNYSLLIWWWICLFFLNKYQHIYWIMAKQNCSTLVRSCKEQHQMGFLVERGSEFVPRIPAELLFPVFQDLDNEHLRFHELVWLHKQLSSTTIFGCHLLTFSPWWKSWEPLFQTEIWLSCATSPYYTT